MSDLIRREDAIRSLQCMMRNCFPEADEALDAVVTTVRELSPVNTEQEHEDRCQAEIARYMDAVRNCEEAENKYKALQMGFIRATADLEDNPPLTWEQLEQMEGKPIWLEQYDPIDEKTGWHTASWYLLEFINDQYFDVRNSDGDQYCFYKDERWQAYRKERK